ncbi:helicase transcription factor CHR28 [Trifolium repens]|nr:helicase transcription factor CHR28 [Trifolium repens]
MSSQQAFNRTLPSSFQSSATRSLPPSSFPPNNRLSYLSSSQLNDPYRSRHHGVEPSTCRYNSTPFASSSESAYHAGAGDEKAPTTDERLIYEAALQEQSPYMPQNPDIAKCPEHLLPLKQ